MILARFVVGLGVGTIGVTMTAMASEFAPPRYQDFAVGFVQAGWPFGSIITAFLTVALLPEYGWRTVLLTIGMLMQAMISQAKRVNEHVTRLVAPPQGPECIDQPESANGLKKLEIWKIETGNMLLVIL